MFFVAWVNVKVLHNLGCFGRSYFAKDRWVSTLSQCFDFSFKHFQTSSFSHKGNLSHKRKISINNQRYIALLCLKVIFDMLPDVKVRRWDLQLDVIPQCIQCIFDHIILSNYIQRWPWHKIIEKYGRNFSSHLTGTSLLVLDLKPVAFLVFGIWLIFVDWSAILV